MFYELILERSERAEEQYNAVKNLIELREKAMAELVEQ